MSISSTPKPASAAAMADYRRHKRKIIEFVVAEALKNPADVAHHGVEAERIVTAGLEFTADTIETVMQVGDPALFEFQLSWAQDRLPHDGVSPAFVLARFRQFASGVALFLAPEHAQEVNPWIEHLIQGQATVVQQTA